MGHCFVLTMTADGLIDIRVSVAGGRRTSTIHYVQVGDHSQGEKIAHKPDTIVYPEQWPEARHVVGPMKSVGEYQTLIQASKLLGIWKSLQDGANSLDQVGRVE